MAPQIRGKGAWASGTTSFVAAVPTGGNAPQSGDAMYIIMESSDSTTAAGTPNIPGGWSRLFEETQGSGATGVTTLTIFGKIAGASEGNVTVDGVGNHCSGSMIVIYDHGLTAITDTVVGTGGGANSASISCAGITVTADSLVIAVSCTTNDANSTANYSGWTNANLSSLTEQEDHGANTGAGGGVGYATGICAGTSTGATTATVTSGNHREVHLGIKGLVAVSTTYAVGYEAGVGLSVTPAFSYEAIQRLSPTYLASYEALQKLGTRTFQNAYESLLRITKAWEENYEARGWVTADSILSWEARQILSVLYNEPYDSLFKLSKTFQKAYESCVPLAAQGQLPYESLVSFSNSWQNSWEALEGTVTFKQTGVARLSLETGATPESRTLHYIGVVARVTDAADVGTLRMRLYEGSNPRSAELETPELTDEFQMYVLHIDDADAASITDYSDLEIRMYG